MTDLLKTPVQYGEWFTHRKGGVYRVIATGLIEATLEPCVVYKAEQGGRVWVRPYDEFNDGRFTLIDGPLTTAEQAAQAKRCGCRGYNDMCGCQNTPDHETLWERAAAAHEVQP